MEDTIKQKIVAQTFRGTALLDPRCKGALLIILGLASYFVNGEVVILMLILAAAIFISAGNGLKLAIKLVVSYVVVAILCALLRCSRVRKPPQTPQKKLPRAIKR